MARPLGSKRSKTAFRPGQLVTHPRLGLGVILCEWGQIQGCLECSQLVERPIVRRGVRKNGIPWEKLLSPCCMGSVVAVSCPGVFDVQFKGQKKPHSMHHRHLELAPLADRLASLDIQPQSKPKQTTP